MIAYKTSGDWADVTSIGRNEVVFEGRNQEYGAYVVRQRYNNTLLIALLISASIGVLCAAVPMVVNYLNRTEEVPKTVERIVDIHPYNFKEREKKIIIPRTVIPPHLPVSTLRVTPPRIVRNEPIETVPTNTSISTATIGVTTSTNPNTGNAIIPIATDPGTIPVDPAPSKLFTIVEHMPTFNGDLEKYLNEKIVIPAFEMSQNIQGVVYITFVVEPDGSISNVQILRGVSGGPGYSAEAIKVIEGMPKWKPGQQNGHNVRVQMNLPIHFSFK